MKNIVTMAAGVAGAFLLPVYPYAALCTVLVVVDCMSAVSLRCRMLRRGVPVSGIISSRGVWRAIVSVVKIYIALLVAHGADKVFDISWCLRFTGAAVCFQQVLSILENEAAAGGASWAASLRKYLVDKAERHLP
ncbi:MAG: phage holin family protein [Muribaculaceae bacterium]|nr:phage holin family protein [Muribaculaceae bacterium]